MSPFDDPAVLERYASLTVDFAANVQPGQLVKVVADLDHAPLARAVARRAYQAGARFVDVMYVDLHVKHARLILAAEETLDFVPPYMGQEMLTLGDLRAASIGIVGQQAPGLLDDVEPSRAARDQLPFVKESVTIMNERTVNWTVVPGPGRAWAQLVHPELGPEDAWARLGEQIVRVCRLDEADPVASWRERAAVLDGVARRLTDQRLDAVRFRGPGTDLTVGLLPSSRWAAAMETTVGGIEHMCNVPSEEIFTAPDPLRVDGVARATLPLNLFGSRVEGLEVEFRDGAAIRIDADRGADVFRGFAARDAGACRLGEVALVDGDGRVGRERQVFFHTLLDENAASHIALGSAYAATAPGDVDRINDSEIHVDFMIGGPEVDVFGITASGEEIPVLIDGMWQIQTSVTP